MLSETEVARDIYQVEEARPSRRSRAPKELSLEQIIKNKTSSPCSLPEFMDYLVCEEENAEILQFFTWFCGYISRFSELTAQEVLLSPPWKPASRDIRSESRNGSTLAVQSHRRGGSDRLEQILEIMDKRNAREALYRVSDQGHKKVNSNPLNFSTPRRFSGTQTSQQPLSHNQSSNSSRELADEEVDAARCAQQPCRRDIDQIVQQYIRGDAPRRLKISAEDLASCLDAVKYTTHPSALLPAFTACETILKSRSHPAFVRKSQRNANTPRLILIRTFATFTILIGLGLSLLFILGPFSKFLRVISLLFWWPSWTILFASFKGICFFLYIRNLRQLRPWEHTTHELDEDADDNDDDDEELSVAGEVKTHISSDNGRRRDNNNNTNNNKFTMMRSTAPSRISSRASVRSATNTVITSYSMAMQTFGGANKWECKSKWEAWQRRSLTMKIWDERVRVESRAIQLLQDRTVLVAVCLGGAVSAFLTVGSLWLPGGR